MNPAARGANDELVNLALIGMVAAFALALVLRVAAKTADALLLVERLKSLPAGRGPVPVWTFVESDAWRYYLRHAA